MNFCVNCGTAVSSPFCTNCGRSTADVVPDRREPTASRVAVVPPPAMELSPAGFPLGATRRYLKVETWFVMVAFLVPVVTSAVIVLVQHISGVADIARFPTIVSDPVWNMVLGILEYLSVGSAVPVALFLLWRTGQSPRSLGLGRPSAVQDLGPGLGLAVAGFLVELVLLIVFSPLLRAHPGLLNKISVSHVPAYYVIWGIALSAITSVTEEVFVNGYLLTRLEQLRWAPGPALVFSLVLRTSYHVYYGIGFLFTVPLGYFVTRSFQKHHRLNRAIAAHFIYDAVLTTISILT